MKVLVTGATGFIGNYVVPELLGRDVQVVACASDAGVARTRSWFRSVDFVAHDIHAGSSENLYDKFGRPHAVIHLAWGHLNNFKSPAHITEVLPAHVRFLENLLTNGLQDLTVTGTCLEYGMKEGRLSEDMPAEPELPYATAKSMLLEELRMLEKKLHFKLKWMRLFYMYGRGQNPKSLIPALEKALENGDERFNMSGGEQVRDFMSVEEVASRIVDFALQNEVLGIVNCSSNRPVTVKQFVAEYLKEKKRTIDINYGFYPYTDYEPFKFWGDDSKLKKIKTYEQNRGV